MIQHIYDLQQIGRLAAAAAKLENGTYDPHYLDEIAARSDALGRLACAFERMADAIQQRERRLQRELRLLQLELGTARARVSFDLSAEIEYLADLLDDNEKQAPVQMHCNASQAA